MCVVISQIPLVTVRKLNTAYKEYNKTTWRCKVVKPYHPGYSHNNIRHKPQIIWNKKLVISSKLQRDYLKTLWAVIERLRFVPTYFIGKSVWQLLKKMLMIKTLPRSVSPLPNTLDIDYPSMCCVLVSTLLSLGQVRCLLRGILNLQSVTIILPL